MLKTMPSVGKKWEQVCHLHETAESRKAFVALQLSSIEDILKALNSGLRTSSSIPVRVKWFLRKSCQLERREQTFVWLTAAGSTNFKGLQYPYNAHRVHWSLGTKFFMNVHERRSAASANFSISRFLTRSYRSAFWFSCYFLPWTWSHYLVWFKGY